ncbi:glycosyltransferase [Clostridium sp. C2-6-12]|uniref:glycosyltransferase n=1 Tax=Clostridium sp. C2-6-12 TaxID=2698832 RepID=UPI001921E9D9|nr:glycosyltransferase [Clostridium sp. C2-6-12]
MKEILPIKKSERRLLSNVIDPENIRKHTDRRGHNVSEENEKMNMVVGQRYIAEYSVKLTQRKGGNKEEFQFESKDISTTGMLLEGNTNGNEFKVGDAVKLKFKIIPGTMPEGFESRVKLKGEVVRIVPANEEHEQLIGIKFNEDLVNYTKKRRGITSIGISSLIMFFIVLVIMIMRAESFVYFKYNKILYAYSIMTATFLLSRYLFGALYKPVPINPEYTPSVSIIIPCFNEEEWIDRTIKSCINQDYPVDKLEVIVVDDCSNDNSVKKIRQTIESLYKEGERFKTRERVRYVVQSQNKGKREALAWGTELAKNEMVVFVDSDSFLEPNAIKNLVQPFQDKRMGGVTGRTDVENKYTNSLTKMQAVRYYIAFRILKAAEAFFDSVTCLSGPISCYRKDLVLKNKEAWLNQKFLGQPATFGDDRSMTNFIMKTHRTGYQDTAVCYTIVPSVYKQFIKQQMRWKRSWLRESLIAGKFIWKKEPFMSLFFYMGLIVPIAAPVVVVYNLMYVPIAHGIFPKTFVMGLLLMSLMMSFADMFFMKSTLWIYGLFFCLFYEGVLLWQMPIAWVTFWKSTWGTRMTPQDIEEMERKEKRKRERMKFRKV